MEEKLCAFHFLSVLRKEKITMKIVELKTENVMRIKAAHIKPDGNLVIIGGRNAQGKSSLMASIQNTLEGAANIAPVPVRQGAEKSTTEIDLGDMIVRRTVQPNGNTSLVITDKEKRRYPSPQAMLDALTGRLSFDPLSFATQDPKKQLETLKTLVGVDFTKDDEEREKVYNERTVVNREVERAQISLSQAAHYPEVKEPVDVTALQTELQEAQKHNEKLGPLKIEASKKAGAYSATPATLKQMETRRNELLAEIDALKAKVVSVEEGIVTLKQAQDTLRKEAVAAQEAANSFDEQDTAAIQQKISEAHEHNRKHATNQARATQEKTLTAKKAEAEKLTKQIAEIDARKQAKLSAAKFPVAGLGFGAGEVTFNGLPFSQASDAERMRVSVAMAAAMNPKLRVVLVKNASLLDEDNLALLAKLADEYELQVWIERVGTKDPSAIIIEDGMVKGAPVETKEAEPETKPARDETVRSKPATKAPSNETEGFPDLIP